MNDQQEFVTDQLSVLMNQTATEAVNRQFAQFYEWMVEKGKNPKKKEGLAQGTASNYVDRLDKLMRRNIKLHAPDDPTRITQEQADQLVTLLNEDTIQKRDGEDYSPDAKRKKSNTLEKYFLWRACTGEDVDTWEPDVTFSQSSYDSPDKLSFTERHLIREAALECGSLPSYYSVSEKERDRINAFVAQRLRKPKEAVTAKDWERADESSKIGSLVLTGLDTGLAPVEVSNATWRWVDLNRNLLIIPEEYALKERETTEIPFDEDTATALSKWRKERRQYAKYDDTDLLWLNQDGNPYTSDNLCDLIRRVCDQAGIDHEDRKIVWYSVRHNAGQCMEEVGGLNEASDQLRHESLETTRRSYGGTAPESRANTLKKINAAAKRAVEDPLFDPYDDDVDLESIGTDSALSEKAKATPTSSDGSQNGTATANDIHIDARIKDTPQQRNELASQILSGSKEDDD